MGPTEINFASIRLDADLLDNLEVFNVTLGNGALKIDQVRRPLVLVRDGKGDDLLERHVILATAQDEDRKRLLPHTAFDVLGDVEHG